MIACVVYWLLPAQWGGTKRWWWLLWASVVFYGFWKIEFLAVIGFSAFVDFYVSLRIHDAATQRGRKLWLIVSLFINLGLLVYFKYTYFLAYNVSAIGALFGEDWNVHVWKITLPLGISFYTFVSLSYTIDVYRCLLDPVRNFGLYLTYVMFWPHMIAGPILRGHELITQIERGHRFDLENAIAGAKMIITGLFLKVVLADQLAPLVDTSFSAKTVLLGGLDVWAMAFAFGFQIYFDFAGYSMIAIGSARLLGIHFPKNFNWPYLSVSPRDFWKRWHITLSAWVRDYLYLPLSGARYHDRSYGGIDIEVEGSKDSAQKLTFALFCSWFVMGLWHGANWNFALWGMWHAALIYIYRKTAGRFKWFESSLGSVFSWALTLCSVMLAWIPFRATTVRQTFELTGKIVDVQSYFQFSLSANFYIIVFLLLVGMLAAAAIVKAKSPLFHRPLVRRLGEVAAFTVMIYFVVIFLKPVNQFIYFQF